MLDSSSGRSVRCSGTDARARPMRPQNRRCCSQERHKAPPPQLRLRTDGRTHLSGPAGPPRGEPVPSPRHTLRRAGYSSRPVSALTTCDPDTALGAAGSRCASQDPGEPVRPARAHGRPDRGGAERRAAGPGALVRTLSPGAIWNPGDAHEDGARAITGSDRIRWWWHRQSAPNADYGRLRARPAAQAAAHRSSRSAWHWPPSRDRPLSTSATDSAVVTLRSCCAGRPGRLARAGGSRGRC
jgi:hypothetical protein